MEQVSLIRLTSIAVPASAQPAPDATVAYSVAEQALPASVAAAIEESRKAALTARSSARTEPFMCAGRSTVMA